MWNAVYSLPCLDSFKNHHYFLSNEMRYTAKGRKVQRGNGSERWGSDRAEVAKHLDPTFRPGVGRGTPSGALEKGAFPDRVLVILDPSYLRLWSVKKRAGGTWRAAWSTAQDGRQERDCQSTTKAPNRPVQGGQQCRKAPRETGSLEAGTNLELPTCLQGTRYL